MITKVKELHVELETNVHDGVLWKRREDEYGREFSTVATWEQIRCRRPTFQGMHLSLGWQLKIGSQHDAKCDLGDRFNCCMFCGEPDETRDHLFFACPYTYTLWLQVIGTLLQPEPSPD
ncbi:hypothetical protein Bca4012_072642 [Brassica carinata]|uniref:Reverse transcriptase zinc-binding domain-containing protein n=1 Tax=Brassica carinata TaxID=52824 RepID=A0A8X7QHH2_BRACI|nr:hypothetical protein Bca52824_065009 [Brassica carinata]